MRDDDSLAVRGEQDAIALVPVDETVEEVSGPLEVAVPGVGPIRPGPVGGGACGPPSAAVFTSVQGLPSATPWMGPPRPGTVRIGRPSAWLRISPVCRSRRRGPA